MLLAAVVAILAVVAMVVIARTHLWWVPGLVVGACAIPTLGYALGSKAAGVIIVNTVLGFASLLSLISYGMHRLLAKPE